MQKQKYFFIIAILLCMGWISSITAQGKMGKIGKIFSKEEATILFGNVKESYEISKAELRKYMLKSGYYLLVQVKNKKFIFANERKRRLDADVQVAQMDPMNIFSTEALTELLQLSNSEVVSVESRGDIVTFSSGAYTLEFSTLCPPICFD